MQNVLKLKNLLEQYPLLEKSMKIFQSNERFEVPSVFLETTDFYSSCGDKVVFGFYTIDKKRIGNNGEIKQDFVLISKNDEIIYYSGGYKKEPNIQHKPIEDFCLRLGKHSSGEWGSVWVWL